SHRKKVCQSGGGGGGGTSRRETNRPTVAPAKKSGRGRGRRNLNPSPSPENCIERIFVWYIDETVLSYFTMAEYNRFAGYNVSVIAFSIFGQKCTRYQACHLIVAVLLISADNWVTSPFATHLSV